MDERDNTARTAAYALNRAWISLVFFGAGLFANYDAAEGPAAAAEVYRTSVVALAASLALCAVFHRAFLAVVKHPLAEYAGPTLTAAGVAVLLPSLAAGGQFEPAQLLASAALTGFGSCVTLLCIGRRYVAAGLEACVHEMLRASIACTVLTFFAQQLPFWPQCGIVLLLPFLSVAALHRAVGDEGAARGGRVLGERIGAGMIARLAACAAVPGTVTGVMRDLYLASSEGFTPLYYLVADAASVLMAAALLLAARRRSAGSVELLLRPTVLICTAGLAVTGPFAGDLTVPYVVITVGYGLFEALVWVILAEVAGRFQYTSVQVFGFGRAFVLATGVLTGGALAGPLAGATADPQIMAPLVATGIVLVVLLRTYVLTEVHTAAFERTLDDGADTADGTGDAAGAGPDDAGHAPGDAERGTGAPPRKVPLARKCTIIGEYYGLTRRETDVFCLMAVGRNSTRIQEELSISSGTVNTHSYHIFQKMGVHAQQELIDLFERADLDLMQAEIARR